jgi:8-oxo-dGTP diphosphatase
VEKRSDNDEADPGFIEIPGGHLNRGETVKDALRRELKEELGINIEKARPVGTGLYTATNGERGRIHYSHVQKWNGRDRVQRG